MRRHEAWRWHLQRLAVVVLAALVLSSVGCQAQTNVDGVWKGKTSQGREIAVTVKNGAVIFLKIGLTLKLDSPCASPGDVVAIDRRGGEAETTYGKAVAISKGSFTVTSGVRDVDAKILGRFTDNAVTGEIELNATGGCSGKGKATWSATRTASTK